MTGSTIITFIIFLFVAIFMIGIGIFQLKSISPVGFYSGERPPKEEELIDVRAWNRKHGMMWVVYGIIIILSAIVGAVIGDSILCIIPLLGGMLVPILVMIWYHHRLVRKYKR